MKLLLALLLSTPSFAQLHVKDLASLYESRFKRADFIVKATDKGFLYGGDPYHNGYEGFITKGKSVLFVKYGEDLVYKFPEYSTYGMIEQELKKAGFVRGNRNWYTNDEALHYTNGSTDVVLWKYLFRTNKINYGVTWAPHRSKQ